MAGLTQVLDPALFIFRNPQQLISSWASRIETYSQIIGVSAEGMAGSIFDEWLERQSSGFNESVQAFADWSLTGVSGVDLWASYLEVEAMSATERLSIQGLAKLEYKALIDIGPANIQFRTAVNIIKNYLESNPGDSLNLGKYESPLNWDDLVTDILDPNSNTSIILVGLYHKQGTEFFIQNTSEAYWIALS